MSLSSAWWHSLPLARRVLAALRVINGIYAAAIVLLLVASLIVPMPIMTGLGVQPGPGTDTLILGLRAIMGIGIAAALLTHLVLGNLLALLASVRAGDPFVADNARRLRWIAIWVLLAEVLRLLVGLISAAVSTPGQRLDLGGGIALAPWLAVLLLFVLAQVFEHGARMRRDLEGTV
ncbi:MAG: DUF2975 domain-containing protein [Xanthomonadales bacterium]|nr:DUF2975 domain-containing protein [Xanthomonadales bacterium]